MKKLFLQAVGKFAAGLIIVAALLFVPAGTLRYGNAWLLLALLFIPMFAAGIVMMFRRPDLLRRRLNAKEEQNEQKTVVTLSAVMFIAAFTAAGLTVRFGWYMFPKWLIIAGSAVFLAAYLMYAEVLRENVYLSRTVEVREGQKVIDSGLYRIVRHPMYAATLFLFLSMGLILGAPASLVILVFYVPIIAMRMKNEEKVLEEGLPGYREYRTRVRYRVIPFLW